MIELPSSIDIRIDHGRLFEGRVIASRDPKISWTLPSIIDRQISCRVQIHAASHSPSSGEETGTLTGNDGKQPLWDSGWVDQADPWLRCAKVPLRSGTRYGLEVTVRTAGGRTFTSGIATFATALLEPWATDWIRPADDFGDAAIYFRRTFDLTEKTTSARLFISGIGLYKVFLNGRELSADVCLAPAVSVYHRRCYYNTYVDLAKDLRIGTNTLCVWVAPGWRRNIGPYLHGRQPAFFGLPMLSARLDTETASGYQTAIETADDWHCACGPITYTNLFDGEIYDAALEHPGLFGGDWLGGEPGESPDDPSGNRSGDRLGGTPGESPDDPPGSRSGDRSDKPQGGLLPCVRHAGPDLVPMCPQELEPIRIQKRYDPVSLTQPAEGTWILDFGQNLAGFCEIRLPAGLPAGIEIRLRHAEVLDDDGLLYIAPLRGARAEDVYRTGNTGKAVLWRPSFTYHGFRYVSISGLPFIPDETIAQACAIYTDVDNRSRFDCGDALVNRIQQLVLATERANLHGLATDCPQRDERMGWMNDATVRFDALAYNFETGLLFPKIVDDIRDEQSEDGAITCTAPFVYGSRPADPVCSSFLTAVWNSWLFYGNRRLMESAWPSLAAWNARLSAMAEGGILRYSLYGDWAGPQDCCQDDTPRSAVTPGELMSTGYMFFNARLLAQMADILGRADDAAAQRAQAEQTRSAFLNEWLKPDGTVATGSQACQAFALRLGILPDNVREAAAARMFEAVRDAGYRLTTGNLCSLYLLQMLAEYGYIDDAWTLLTRQEYPSWGFMVANGATTVWERFELKKDPGMNSHCHPMYGAVGAFLHGHIAGVRPVEGGFAKVAIKPYVPTALLYAESQLDTCRGRIGVRWRKQYGRLDLDITLPSGVTAEVDWAGQQRVIGGGWHRL